MINVNKYLINGASYLATVSAFLKFYKSKAGKNECKRNSFELVSCL